MSVDYAHTCKSKLKGLFVKKLSSETWFFSAVLSSRANSVGLIYYFNEAIVPRTIFWMFVWGKIQIKETFNFRAWYLHREHNWCSLCNKIFKPETIYNQHDANHSDEYMSPIYLNVISIVQNWKENFVLEKIQGNFMKNVDVEKGSAGRGKEVFLRNAS